MKKLSLVLLLWLCACCLVFGQVNSARRALFNEANGTVGKRVPSGWKEWDGLFWKSTDISVGKDYTALQVKGNIVELAMVGCLFANSSAQTRWIKESYDTLVADKWEILSNNAGDWVLKKGDILVTYESSSTNDGTLTTAVVFLNQSTANAPAASASIDGYWETNNGRKTITVTGNTAVLNWVGFTPLWEDAVKKRLY